MLRFAILLVLLQHLYLKPAFPQSWQELNEKVLEHYNAGDYQQGVEYAERALAQAEKEFGKEHEDYGTSLYNLASLYENTGQYDKALLMYLEALEFTGKTLGTEHPDYGDLLLKLAMLYESMGEYGNALTLYNEALENIENALGKAHADYGVCLGNLAGLFEKTGELDKALTLHHKTVEIIENALGKQHPYYSAALSNMAGLYNSMDENDKALLLYHEVLGNIEATLGKEHSHYGGVLNNIASIHRSMGQYEKALQYYLEALQNTEISVGREHPHYAIRLNNIAGVLKEMGEYEKAYNIYQAALEYGEISLGKEHAYYGLFLNNLAGLYEVAEEYEKALSLYLQSLEIAEKTLGKMHPDYAVLVNNLAVLYEKTGQYDKALPLYQEALGYCEKVLGKQHSDYGRHLNNLAGLHEKMKNYSKALPLYLEALENSLLNIDRTFGFLSEAEKENFMKTLSYNFEINHSFFKTYSSEIPESGGHAYNIELATKGMILQSGINMRMAILNSGNPDALEKFDKWFDLRSIIAKQYGLPVTDRRADLKTLEANAEILERELARFSNAFGSAQSGSPTWKEIQKNLKPNETAIEFTSFSYHNGFNWTDSTLYIALVLRKEDKHPQLVYLCEQRQLDSLLTRTGSSDAGFITGLYRGAEVAEKVSYGKRLYELVWQPLDDFLQKGNNVYFAPSGSLHQIAFAAIPYNQNTLLSDRYRLHQLSTTAMLLRPSNFNTTTPTDMSLFGGIQYDVTQEEMFANVKKTSVHDAAIVSRSLPDNLDRGNENWTYLPGTLREVNSIASIAKEKKIKVQLYTGGTAVEESFKQLAGKNSPRIVHIATHGFFFPDPKKEKPDDRRTETQHVYRASDNPLHRAGLLFAGANSAWGGEAVPEGLDDGILTAYEAANVTLSNTQLVALSACETGLGDIKGSEGVFGLQRAFKAAGAEYLLMSLWKVPDEETAEFMTYFYSAWFSGKTIPDAFHSTQQYMKSKYPNDPYKWAAFVLVR